MHAARTIAAFVLSVTWAVPIYGQPPARTGAGVGVDAQGGPAIDPTANMVAATLAANRRQDDLRKAQEKYVDSQLLHLRDMATLRAEHAEQLRAMEASRLDSIRQVDVLAVTTTADRLRNQLDTTAVTMATQQTNIVAGLNERLSALEKASYASAGRQAMADPQMAELLVEMKSLRDSRAVSTGTSQGLGLSAGVVVQIISLAFCSSCSSSPPPPGPPSSSP